MQRMMGQWTVGGSFRGDTICQTQTLRVVCMAFPTAVVISNRLGPLHIRWDKANYDIHRRKVNEGSCEQRQYLFTFVVNLTHPEKMFSSCLVLSYVHGALCSMQGFEVKQRKSG